MPATEIERFAAFLGSLDGPDAMAQALRSAKQLAAVEADAGKLAAAPPLMTAAEASARRAALVANARAIIEEHGYDVSIARLTSDDDDAKAARAFVARKLVSAQGLDAREADAIVRAAATDVAPYFDEAFAADWGAPPKDWPALVDGLIIDGLTHWIGGTHGALKSTVGAHAALTALDAGRDVVWLDWEVGRDQARGRLWTAGIRDGEQVGRLFHYRNGPNLREDGMAKLLAEVGAMAAPLIVIDSASKALASLGLNENDNGEVSRFTTDVLAPLKAAGGTLYVIDHAGRSQAASSDYVARGASTKDADADLTYRFDVTEAPTRESVGKLRVVCQKDRESARGEGWSPSRYSRFGERWYAVGDAAGGLPVKPMEQPSDASSAARHADLRRAIAARLAETPEDVVSQRTLREDLRARDVKFRNDALPGVLREMNADPDEPVRLTDAGSAQYVEGHGVGLPIGGRS